MPVDVEEFMHGLAIIADNHNIRVTLKQSGKGAAICGAICFIGKNLFYDKNMNFFFKFIYFFI